MAGENSNNGMSNGPARTSTFQTQINDDEFQKFKDWIYKRAGIHLADHKKALVVGRLAPRMRHYKFQTYHDYFELLSSEKQPNDELQIAIDLLTTNETFFFREPKHFDFLRDRVLLNHKRDRNLRIWSAACSSGEEPYSIAMLTASVLGDSPWEIVASDISQRMVERARSGHYAMKRAEHIPMEMLHKYCLKGIQEHAGTFIINNHIKHRVRFMNLNLNERLPNLGEFDVIFLRNVMIYFDMDTKRNVVNRLLPFLKKDGYLIVGHSESLNGICDNTKAIQPSIYSRVQV